MEKPKIIQYRGKEFRTYERVAFPNPPTNSIRMRDFDAVNELLTYFLLGDDSYLGDYSDDKTSLDIIVSAPSQMQADRIGRLHSVMQDPKMSRQVLGYPFKKIHEVTGKPENAYGTYEFPEFVLEPGKFLWMRRADISLKFIESQAFRLMLNQGEIKAFF